MRRLSRRMCCPAQIRVFRWKCKKGHSWRALIYTRTGPKPTKCPYCQGHAVEPKTSLAGKNPALAQYWHPSKNAVSPEQVAPNSNQVFWWQCPEGHEWQEAPNQLQKHVPDRICPYCKPPKTIQGILPGGVESSACPAMASAEKQLHCGADCTYSNKRCGGDAKKGMSGRQAQARCQGQQKEACPTAITERFGLETPLAYLAPELAAIGTEQKSPLTPNRFFPWSSKRVWWKCKKRARVADNTGQTLRGDGCPYCSGHRASAENCLAPHILKIAKEWDEEENAPLTPQDVTPGSRKRVWWKCRRGIHGSRQWMDASIAKAARYAIMNRFGINPLPRSIGTAC